ncbi:MAG: DASH family cryptochrome [Raineya sp.]
MQKVLVWFRNDLRLHDQIALYQATQKAQEVYAVYCIDERHFVKNSLGMPRTNTFRAKFLLESLCDLRLSMRKLGGDLIVRFGKPEIEVARIARELGVNAVFASKEATDEELKVELALEKKLAIQKINLELFWQYTLYHLEDLPFPIAHLPDIFTEFRKSVEKYTSVRKSLPKPQKLNPIPENFFVGEIPSLKKLGLQERTHCPKAAILFQGGETEGLKRLHQYFWEKDALKNYKETRNALIGADYSSKFSPWLALGCLSPRFIYEQVKLYEKERIQNESTYWLVFELIWRDYFRFVAKKYGNSLFWETGIKNENVALQNNQKIFRAWTEGETGVPFIDANMRELKATGFMSNRGRQNVASFLVKDLHINWVWGAMYFESQLIDYDVCSNWGNWNYIAGVGNDPRENRYFNTYSQAKRYDPQGEYIKLWLPELSQLPAAKLHHFQELSPQELESYKVKIGVNYPKPLIQFLASK